MKIAKISLGVIVVFIFFAAIFGPLQVFTPSSYAIDSNKSSVPLQAPSNIVVTPGVGYINVSWNEGQDSQDTGVKYTVTSSPAGLSCNVKDASACNMYDSVSTPYTFSVNASKPGLGTSPSSISTPALNPHLVLVVAGQSNASGFQSYDIDPTTGINYFAPPYTNGADSNDLITWLPWSIEQGNAATPAPLDSTQYLTGSAPASIFGPEIGLARQLWTDNQRPLTIIKDAYGATNLADNWSPTGSGALPNGLFPAMVSNVIGTMYNDAQNGQFDVLGGFYWYQGESDAGVPAMAKDYKKNIVAFIKAVRKQLPMNANAPIVLAKEDVSEYVSSAEASGSLTTAQGNVILNSNNEVRFADDYAAYTLPSVFEVDSLGLTREPPYLHLSNTSELTIGQEMANVSVNSIP